MKKFLILSLSIISVLFIFNSPVIIAQNAGSKDEVCKGAGVVCTNPETSVNNVIKTALTLFRVIIGLVAVFYIIYAGLKFITSSGDANKVASARNTIIYAAIGLIIVVVAPSLVQFVLNRIN